jgi:hypothetical protein
LNVKTLSTLSGVKIYIYSCLCELFDLSSKAGSLRGRNEGIEHRGAEASSNGWTSQNSGKGKGRGLHVEMILVEPLAPLGVEVTGKIPRRPRPIRSC